jgi:hypothetical protein
MVTPTCRWKDGPVLLRTKGIRLYSNRPKGDGSWRPCGDFQPLNLVTEPDVYPLPNMLDFAAKAAGCTVFSKIELRKGYHQIPVSAEHRHRHPLQPV